MIRCRKHLLAVALVALAAHLFPNSASAQLHYKTVTRIVKATSSTPAGDQSDEQSDYGFEDSSLAAGAFVEDLESFVDARSIHGSWLREDSITSFGMAHLITEGAGGGSVDNVFNVTFSTDVPVTYTLGGFSVGGTVQLLDSTVIAGLGLRGQSPSNVGVLNPGTLYTLDVRSRSNSSLQGDYDFELLVTPVPEPSFVWILLALPFVLRRRR